MKRVAIIDLGTQSAIYLLADRGDDGTLRVKDQDAKSVRLGQGLYASGRIGDTGLERAVQALAQFKARGEAQGADRVLASGTRVFRWAANGEEAAKRIVQATGLDLHVLSEEEEAAYGYLGVASGPSGASEPGALAVIDIGGGSTELSFGVGQKLESSVSLEIGAVGLTEKWAAGDGFTGAVTLPGEAEGPWKPWLASARNLVAVAGTATTLAATLLGMERYDAERVEGFELHRERLEAFISAFHGMDDAVRRRLVAVAPERADILLAGCVILHRLLTLSGTDRLRVSDWGLRHGLAQAAFLGQWPHPTV